MSRSINAVLVGTFTLRFSTGLTGAMLAFYLAKLPEFGGPEVSGTVAGILTATYFAAELLLSPAFGILSDRVGAHRVMQIGPVFGAVAVTLTALTTDLWLIGGTRWLEGMAAAAAMPSILGYIAITTSGNQALRGRTVARFEAATVGGLGVGAVVAGPLFEQFGSAAFLVNAGIYGVSFLIYRYGVRPVETDPAAIAAAGERPISSAEVRPARFNFAHYRRLFTTRGIWLLAPTWIALNAIIGAWTTQVFFQLVKDNPDPAFADQVLMGGFDPAQVSIGMGIAFAVFLAGIFASGRVLRRFRRTTIMAGGVVGGLVMMAAVFGLNHSIDQASAVRVGLVLIGLIGLFVLAGGTPAALGLLADISETHPADRGAIMGLYSIFLGFGQIIGSVAAGVAADWAGVDGLLVASVFLLVAALVPLRWLRESEHLVGVRAMPAGSDPATA
jgi:MFS family permease